MGRLDIARSLSAILVASTLLAAEPDGNRLSYLDGINPYYPHIGFARLTTPQWVGEEGVEAVVVLAIDDMTDNPATYEKYLRPILDRLKAIDGRAPVSIMTCRIDPESPQVQAWLKEGLAIDVHTLKHPCPLLQKGDFAEARRNVHGGVDLIGQIPGNLPIGFRMPCCDSLNTPSPRFYAEIFNESSPEGRSLAIDSSVFQVFTPADPGLPRALVVEPDGRERFRKYIPFPSFVNTIENYPYPYVIGGLCWEFPCMVPSDWEAQHLQKPNNPATVRDMKAALDATVVKQGVFNLVFHPHNWIKAEQVVELIDHAVETHGKKVKFLNFREAKGRLDRNLLGGQPLRDAGGADNGVRLLDLNNDRFMDVIVSNSHKTATRLWNPSEGGWKVVPFPIRLVENEGKGVVGGSRVQFGVMDRDGFATMIDGVGRSAWRFDGSAWVEDPRRVEGLNLDGPPGSGPRRGDARDSGFRLIDIDGDGFSEAVVANPALNSGFRWSGEEKRWTKLPFALPEGARVVDAEGRDAGLRFVDLDEDGRDDILFSNDRGYGVFLFDTMKNGWARKVMAGRAGDKKALPKIVRDGMDNGAWFHSRHLWVQNEDTATLPDLVDRRSFNDLLKDVEPRAKSPESSLRSIRVRPGFKVELVASEPLVQDPIAFDWGADGTLWVVEMGDYPLGVDGRGKPGGRIRALRDADGDGRFDSSTEFLDGLGFPTGLMPWRGGVLIACAPDILFAEDTDGDGKADLRRVLFTGFVEGNQQHRFNGFELGLDGWVHGANGDSGGKVRSLVSGATVDIQGRDFRFRPDDGRFEAESGQTQFGRHRDSWGHQFGVSNPIWGWHFVLSDRDLRRNPHFAAPDPRKTLEPDTRLFPSSRTPSRFNDPAAANHVTSANSPTPYRDELFGPAFANSLFVSEPVHNLVHRMVLEPEGVTFRGRRPVDELDREFLASSDNWFRPTMLKTGPDGALWIADMYRAVIEHPEWIPDDWEAKLDLLAGRDRGRIYRVFPVDKTPRPLTPLDRLDTAGLVASLDSASGWVRDTAHRLLLHRADGRAAAPLRKLAAGAKRPETRVQALWVLENLGAMTAETIVEALSDAHPQVRRNALDAGRGLLKGTPKLGESALRLVGDPDAQVRLQLALSLGDWDDPGAGRALAALARRDPDDPWIRAAVLSSAEPHAGTILTALFTESGGGVPSPAIVEPLFAMAGTIEDRRRLAPLVRAVATPSGNGPAGTYATWQFSALAGLLDAADRDRTPLARWGEGTPELGREIERLDGLVRAARLLVADDRADIESRALAIRLLGRDESARDADRALLADLLRPQVAGPLQQTAVAVLGRSTDPKVAATLLADWRGHAPALRDAVLETILSRDTWTSALLDALETKAIPSAEVGPTHRRRLLDRRDPDLKRRAEGILSREVSSRADVIARYREAAHAPGNPELGAIVFKKLCATCHRFGELGTSVGPDLAALSDKSPESLLVGILDPNRAFEAKDTSFTVQTSDGRILSGLIASETATAVTLLRQEGKSDVLLRADIDAIAGSGQSLMPEGLEKDLSPVDLSNLIAYLSARAEPRSPCSCCSY